VPCEAIICKHFHCCNYAHIDALSHNISLIAEACLDAAAEALPASKQKGTRGCIPSWKEQIAPPPLEKNLFFGIIYGKSVGNLTMAR